jgi:hypothetical protein
MEEQKGRLTALARLTCRWRNRRCQGDKNWQLLPSAATWHRCPPPGWRLRVCIPADVHASRVLSALAFAARQGGWRSGLMSSPVRKWVAQRWSPLVLVVASPEAEAVCAASGLSVCDLLAPHCTSTPNGACAARPPHPTARRPSAAAPVPDGSSRQVWGSGHSPPRFLRPPCDVFLHTAPIRTSEVPFRLREFTLRVAYPAECEPLSAEVRGGTLARGGLTPPRNATDNTSPRPLQAAEAAIASVLSALDAGVDRDAAALAWAPQQQAVAAVASSAQGVEGSGAALRSAVLGATQGADCEAVDHPVACACPVRGVCVVGCFALSYSSLPAVQACWCSPPHAKATPCAPSQTCSGEETCRPC